MSDAPNHKVKALELANQHMGEKPSEIVARATAYHTFLAGTDSGSKLAAATGAAAATKPAAANASGAANKPATKPAAGAAPAGAKPAAAGKPPAAAKPAATKPAAAATPPASDDGLTMADVSKALQGILNRNVDPAADKATQEAQRAPGKVEAYKILEEHGKAKSVKDVKPALYKAVIDACAAALAAPAAAEDDDLGGGGDFDDPPEKTAGGADADAQGDDL